MVPNSPTVLVINLKRDVARWRKLSAALQQTSLPVIRVSAVDARRKHALIRSSIRRDFFSETLQRPLTPGESCCVLSHILALKRIIRLNLSTAIILEDDAIIDNRFNKFLVSDLPLFLRRADIVKLEGNLRDPYVSKDGPTLSTGAVCKLIIPFKPSLHSAGYAVTSEGARALLKAFSTMADPLDLLLAYYERHRISYGEVRPLIIQQDASQSSNLESERNQTALRKTLRRRATKLRKIILRTIVFVRIVVASRLHLHNEQRNRT